MHRTATATGDSSHSETSFLFELEQKTAALNASVSSCDSELVFDGLDPVFKLKNISVCKTAKLLRILSLALSCRAIDLLASLLKKLGDHDGSITAQLEEERPP